MSSMDGLLQQLDRVSSDTVSHHHPRQKDNICSSSLTLTLKAEGHAFKTADNFITDLTEIQHNGALLWNGSVDNCSSEHILKTNEGVVVKGTESFDSRENKVDFLNGFEGQVTVIDADSARSHNTHLEKPPNLGSSQDSSQFPKAVDTLDNLQSVNTQKTSQGSLVTDPPSLSSLPLNSSPLSYQKDVTHSSLNHTSQSLSSFPCHTRSLSQTTSQLTSLIEKAESGTVQDTSYVTNLFEGSNVKVLSDKLDSIHLKNVPDTLNFEKPDIIPCDLRNVQDSVISNGLSMALDTSDVKEIAFESSPKTSQSCEVLQSCLLEPEAQATSLTHSSCPDWKLDRRESGHLFWRRDSSTLNGIDPSSRVKFRYDIEVREFESRNSETEDLIDDDCDHVYDDDDDDDDEDDDVNDEVEFQGGRKRVTNFKAFVSTREESASVGTSAVICVVAIVAIVVLASYRWLLSLVALI